MYHNLTILNNENEYRQFYINYYCNTDIITHYGIRVSFKPDQFEHAFFSSKLRHKKDKSIFNTERAKRITWVKKVLEDQNVPIYQGWDSKKKIHDATRRVALVTPDGYVVVIRFITKNHARFVTAYLIDNPSVLKKIQAGPLANLAEF